MLSLYSLIRLTILESQNEAKQDRSCPWRNKYPIQMGPGPGPVRIRIRVPGPGPRYCFWASEEGKETAPLC